MNRSRLVWSSVLLVLALLGVGTWAALRPLAHAPGPGETVEILVPPGAGAHAIGQQLREAGLVRSPRLFALAARLRGVDASLKSGRYRFPSGLGWGEILDIVARGEV